MDLGLLAPVTQSRPVDQTPTTRDSTRSRSPIRRSSSSELDPRDASSVDFSAALDTEEKVKDRSVSDDEDDDFRGKSQRRNISCFARL